MNPAKLLASMCALAIISSSPALTAGAATLNANPGNIDTVLVRAKGGDIVVLTPGEYRDVSIAKRTFKPPLTINASAATVTGWQITKSAGLVFQGGTYKIGPPITNPRTGELMFTSALRGDGVDGLSVRNASFVGPGHADTGQGVVYGEGYGFFVNGGSDITLEDSTFAGFKSSAVIGKVDRFHVARILFTAMRSDGLDVAESYHGVIEGLECSGTVIRDKEHPDCIQLWSRHTSPPVSDIIIRKNKVVGNSQGISLFNHVRDGVDDGGFDRITIEDNDVDVSYPSGITIMAGRDSVVRNNRIRTQPNAKWRASLRLSEGVRSCGNTVGPGGGKPSVVDPHC